MIDYMLGPPESWLVRAVDPVGYLVREWADGIPIFFRPGESA